MKLFHKIFLCFVVIFGITFQVVGYLLINFAYGNAIEQEKKIAFQDFQYNRYILQSILYSEPEFFSKGKDEIAGVLRNFTVPVYVYGLDQNYNISDMKVLPEEINFKEIEDGKVSYQIYEKKGENLHSDSLYQFSNYLPVDKSTYSVLKKSGGSLEKNCPGKFFSENLYRRKR